MTTVDRNQWIRDRLSFLQEQLAADDVDEVQRSSIEGEIEALRGEQARTRGWLRRALGLSRRGPW